MNRSNGPPNAFEPGKPGTAGRDRAEASIEELRKRGGMFVNAVRATRMPMALTDPNLPGNPIVFANEAFLKLSGYRMDEVLGQQPHFMNGPGTDPQDRARFTEALRSNQDDVFDTVQYGKNGTRFVATVLLSAFKDEEGHVLNHFMSWLDVTRRSDAEDEVLEVRAAQAALRDSERRARTLLAELQHRSRNTLAVIRSIVRRTAAMSDSVEQFRQHLDARLGAFARTQAHLTRDPQGDVDLELIVRDELLAHAAESSKHVTIHGPEARLTPGQAETIGLAIHELTTNAVKHGALSEDGNKLDVSWSVKGEGDERTLHFSWRERLKDRALSAPTRSGFGTELLERVMAYALDAESNIEFRPEGLLYEAAIPLSATAKPLT